MARKSTKLTKLDIVAALPDAPDGYEYSIETVSPLITKVWLEHCRHFDYNLGDPVHTIYCFIKGRKVHKPKDSKACYVKSHCTIEELSTQDPYSLLNPDTVVSLLHL